jgi:hypothetical protein
MKHVMIGGALLVLLVLVVSFFFADEWQNAPQASSSFEECVAQGNVVMESYPRQCRDEAGNLHSEDITAGWEAVYSNASDDLIRTVNIEAGDSVSSPLVITGEARGYWFFEASFPVTIVDWDGKIIAEHFATAEGEWMTEEFVPFTATIVFETPEQVTPVNRGAIILRRDNPSDLPENDAALEIPIVFGQ